MKYLLFALVFSQQSIACPILVNKENAKLAMAGQPGDRLPQCIVGKEPCFCLSYVEPEVAMFIQDGNGGEMLATDPAKVAAKKAAELAREAAREKAAEDRRAAAAAKKLAKEQALAKILSSDKVDPDVKEAFKQLME